jgi:hypothetical protein
VSTHFEIEKNWKQDMEIDSKLAHAHRLMNELSGLFAMSENSKHFRETAHKLWDERQRIVSRWN